MKKLFILLFTFFYLSANTVFADDAITKGMNFLRSKQDNNGKITNGFSAPSQWSAIAFMSNGIDPSTVKKSDKSLTEFLLTDIPANDTPTEWENRILAIVAIHGDPTNFNGVNYISHLQSFYTTNQIGDTCSLNDDIFGLLALIAAGPTADTSIKQNTLHFLISKQDSTDGGFGFSAPGCAWYSTSTDITAAAIQALQASKNNNVTDPDLDNAIYKAKLYLLTNQNNDGGFGYFGSSDTDTTGWVLMGLNALGLGASDQANKAKAYLLAQQSPFDGGFMAYDYGTNTMQSNSTTTAQSITALLGKTWILTIFQPNTTSASTATPSAMVTPTLTPSITPTPTPSSGLTSVSQNTILYQTITITITPTPKKTKKTLLPKNDLAQKSADVLGSTTKKNQNTQPKTITTTVLAASTRNPMYLFFSLGLFFLSGFFFVRNKF